MVGSGRTTRAREPRSEAGAAQVTDGRFGNGSRPQPPRSGALAAARAAFGPTTRCGLWPDCFRAKVGEELDKVGRHALEFGGPRGDQSALKRLYSGPHPITCLRWVVSRIHHKLLHLGSKQAFWSSFPQNGLSKSYYWSVTRSVTLARAMKSTP